MPKDIVGNEIKIGAEVVFGLAGTMTQAIGEVVGISPKTVSIRYTVPWDSWRSDVHRRTFDNVVVVVRVLDTEENQG